MVLISDILDLSKIESNTMEFHFEKVSLNGILESIYSAQKMNLRKGVELLLRPSGPGGSYLYEILRVWGKLSTILSIMR